MDAGRHPVGQHRSTFRMLDTAGPSNLERGKKDQRTNAGQKTDRQTESAHETLPARRTVSRRNCCRRKVASCSSYKYLTFYVCQQYGPRCNERVSSPFHTISSFRHFVISNCPHSSLPDCPEDPWLLFALRAELRRCRLSSVCRSTKAAKNSTNGRVRGYRGTSRYRPYLRRTKSTDGSDKKDESKRKENELVSSRCAAPA